MHRGNSLWNVMIRLISRPFSHVRDLMKQSPAPPIPLESPWRPLVQVVNNHRLRPEGGGETHQGCLLLEGVCWSLCCSHQRDQDCPLQRTRCIFHNAPPPIQTPFTSHTLKAVECETALAASLGLTFRWTVQGFWSLGGFETPVSDTVLPLRCCQCAFGHCNSYTCEM